MKYRASDFRRFCAVWNAAYLPVCKRHTAQKGENEPPEALMARYGERTISRMLNKSYAKAYLLSGDNLRLRV